jgi:hypothetical protein
VSRLLLFALGAVILMSVGSGCALGMWAADRSNDFIDMFGLRVCGNLGLGLEANVRATEAFQTGLGWSEKYCIGFKGRDVGVYLEQSYSLPFMPSDWLPWIYPSPFGSERCLKREKQGGTFPDVSVSRQVFFGVPSDVAFGRKGEKTNYDRRYDEVGVSAYAVMVGVEFEVRLLEVLDFALGMATFGLVDVMGDDWLKQPPEVRATWWKKTPKKAAPKRTPEKKEPPKTETPVTEPPK